MAQWIIYGSNGVAKAKVKELELHDEWMAECFLTVSIKNATPISFAVGDYIDYRGERYTIQYDPNVIKKATSGSYGEGFTYDNIKFVGLQDEVVRCDFNDLVLNDNDMHYSALPTFPFYCESVDDLLDRIQANLEDLYPGQWIVIGLNTVRNFQRGTAVGRAQAFVNAYKQYIDPTGAAHTDPYGKQGVAETADHITCWDAMKKVHDDFDLNFIVRGRVIVVGTAGVFTANTFRYGKGNGLKEIERIGESDQRIVTRLRAYGSEENLPAHYYNTVNKQVYANVTSILHKFDTTGADFLLNLDFDKKYFTYRSESYPGTTEAPNYIIEMKANDVTVRGYVTKDTTSGKCYVYCESVAGDDDRDEPDATKMAAFVEALTANDRLDFVDYVNRDAFGEGHYDYATSHLPDNMAVSRLMLPGFPTMSLNAWVQAHKNDADKTWLAQAIADGFTFSTEIYRPYIDSPNKTQYGVRPGSVYFDGSDETENIHPTIEGMTYNDAPIDEIYAADQVEDNGVYPAGEEVKPIKITLPNLGFALDKYYEDGASIDMKNGMCGARSFKLTGKPKKNNDNRWVCEVERVHDDSLDLWFPYSDFQIHGSSEVGRDHGDKYVLTGIDMPDAYIDAAAVKLLQYSIEALKKNHAPRYTYQPRIDNTFMQRQHDTASASQGVVSLHDTLKAGDVFAFSDTDLNIDANVIIDILTIRENGDNGIPTYEVTLRNEKQVETIQKITNKIDSVISGDAIFGGGGSMAMQQYQSLIDKNIQGKYLSRQKDDNAEGVITFNKGVKIGQYHSRFLGSGAAIDPEGNSEFESIYSRSFISTPEFRFNRISVTEGEQWCTNGYGTIESVVKGVDEYGNEINGGIITLHLEENDFASVAAGDICRGIYNDIAGTYNPPAMDNDASYAAGSYKEGSGIGFSAKQGFFTSYFYIDHIITREQGKCSFVYKLRSSTTPHPCPFMKFAQYGSFTDATRRASSYATSIGHYYEMVLEGVQTWTIESANIVYRKGYLGDLVIELVDGTSRQLQGYGLYAQNNIYFGNAVIQLDPYTLEMLEEDLSTYDVSFGEHVDMIVVDDTGNVIGGIYTETEEGGVTTREYRIHSAITVRKKGTLLTEALAGAEAGLGTYKINFTPIGCSVMIENSTMYITGIDHVKDGVAGSGDDTDFDYDAMRAVDSCRVDFTIDCEGKTSIQKSIPIAIKHDSQPFVGADITNEFSAVSWNTKTQSYAGLPITFDFKMWHNDEVLDITSVDDISVSPSITGMTVSKSIVENASGNKVAHIVIFALPADLGLVTDLEITCVATYSGVRYERTLVHTINKSTDTNVYSLIPSVDEVIVNKNTGGLSSNSVDISVVCDSSDNKHYAVAYNQFGTHQICICYKKFYTNGTSDANETEYTGTAVSVDSSVERVSFFLYKKVGTTIDRTVLHDKEDVPIIANGQDGKGVEYIFITQNTETPVPTINDVAADRQVDNYCPYTDAQHTAQWTDEPTGVASNAKFEFYAQRKKVNGVWQPFGEVKLWNRYVVDGVTPYIIDLSNEQSFVVVDSNGNETYETSRLMLFLGQSYAFNDFAITITPVNITCNNSSAAFTLTAEQKAAAQAAGYYTLTPSAITADSATITVTATKGNIVLSAVYKINKSNFAYSLITSLDTIRKDKNGSIVSTDVTLTLQVKKIVGASTSILTTYSELTAEGLSLNYVNSSGSNALTAISIATSILIGSGAWGKIELVRNNVIVDAERLNVVSDGSDGDGGYGIVLTLTRDNYTEDNWAAYAVVGENENFGYSGDVTVRAGDYFIVEGISTDSGLMHTATFKCTSQTPTKVYGDCISHICDGEKGDQGDDGSYYVKEYAVGDSRTTAPTSGWDATQPSPSDGQYVWERSRLYNPNTGTYGSYVYVCLTGLKGATGNTGAMYYPAGIHDPNKAYSVTAQLVPVVCSGSSYYYAKKSISANQNIPVSNTTYWAAFTTFAAAFVQVLFSSFAALGSFIVNGKYFISQYGTVNGVLSNDYSNANFEPYLKMNAEDGYIYAKKGTIGGFTINPEYLGDTSGDYYTYLAPDGYLALKNPKTGDHAHANGAIYVQGGALIQGDDTHPLRLLNGNGETEVKGNPLNINTNAALTTNIGNGGSSSILSVNSKTTFHQPVSVNTSMAITGLFAAGGNIKISSFILPESPEIGQSFFCKGVTTDLTVSVKSGTNHVIMASDSRQTVTSLSLQDNSAILVYMKENTWVHFRCD